MILFLDETGTQNFTKPGKKPHHYDVFALTGCLFDTGDVQDAVRTGNEFKFRHWKHEGVVIHRCEINKATGYFKRFDDRARREKFLREFQGYVTGLPFLYYAAGVKKTDYAARYGPGGADLYHLCLGLMLERVGCHLKKSSRKNLLVVAEARGKKEDDALRAAFDDLRNGRVGPMHWLHPSDWSGLDLRLEIVTKSQNIVGLQIADFLGIPVGWHIMNGGQASDWSDPGNVLSELLTKGRIVDGRPDFAVKIYKSRAIPYDTKKRPYGRSDRVI